MSIYMLIEIQVKDNELYSQYVDQVSSVIEKYGGKYIVRGGAVRSLSANWQPERIILIRFDRIEQWNECFGSQEYLALAPLRGNSADSKAVILEEYVA